MEKPDYLAIAKSLYVEGSWGKSVDVNALEKTLKNMWEQGYKYAVINDWWIAQDGSRDPEAAKALTQEDFHMSEAEVENYQEKIPRWNPHLPGQIKDLT